LALYPDGSNLHTGNKAKKAGPNKQVNGDKLTEATSALSVDDVPKVKSKNLNVVEEFRKSNLKQTSNFVVIGKYKDLSLLQ
jgi:elongation factor 1 alpha-like protein